MAGIRIFAGCYERFLFGFECPDSLMTAASPSPGQPVVTLERKYTFAAHKQAVKCVAAAGAFLASGGADDTIHLYDLQRDKDLGFLMNPGDGAVPCLEFFTPAEAAGATHLFSGSADGSISIWQSGGGWEHLKTMRGHKGAINGMAVHRSGRLALSVARDSHIRMWNLLKGRCSYTAKLEMEGDAVRFTPGGDAYALICGSKVTVHLTSGEGGILATLPHSRRVLCMTQSSDDVLLTGVEDGSVKVWDLRSSSCAHSLERCHNSRVRGLAVLKASGGSAIPEMFGTASSDGMVKVWDSRMLSSSSSQQPQAAGGGSSTVCLASASTNARITCLCTVPKLQRAKGSVVEAARPVGPAATAAVAAAAATSGAGGEGSRSAALGPLKQKKALVQSKGEDRALMHVEAGGPSSAAVLSALPRGEERTERDARLGGVAGRASPAGGKQQAAKPCQGDSVVKKVKPSAAGIHHQERGSRAPVGAVKFDLGDLQPVTRKKATKAAEKSGFVNKSATLEAEHLLALHQKAQKRPKIQNQAAGKCRKAAAGEDLPLDSAVVGQAKKFKPGSRLSDMWCQKDT